MKKLIPILSATCMMLLLLAGNPEKAWSQASFNPDTVKAGMFDMGKMWTFDYPPINYFKQTYGFAPDEKWFEKARLSALRFANYCSASFVSADGLVMTNHHCARESGTNVQQPGENFNETGFYAQKLTDERKVPGLYVDQLRKIEDVTDRVQSVISKYPIGSEQVKAKNDEFNAIRDEYGKKDDWKGLELQIITLYNGGKYALYGFKRYHDVRLVFMPEVNLGFFGGDYDNFTYPRYDLDCSFFRVYDENGQPLKTDNYFKFSQQIVKENDPVFIIGNPGSTGRLWTMSDLKFRQSYYLPYVLTYLKNHSSILQEYNKVAKSDSLINEIFGYENSIKALGGELNGLNDQYLMARKQAFENKFKSDVENKPALAGQISIWNHIDELNADLAKAFPETFLFSPNPDHTGNTLAYAYILAQYFNLLKENNEQAAQIKRRLGIFPVPTIPSLEKNYLTAYLTELKNAFGENDPLVKAALNGKTPEEASQILLSTTKLNDPAVRSELVNANEAFMADFNDPVFELAKMAVARYVPAREKYSQASQQLEGYRNELGRLAFDIYNTQIPPDATFSLRIADGVVKGYNYNGTKAPYHTTFYGLYNRYYSFNKEYPWSLPQRWQNPPSELLPLPLDFVSTNDIIGGNSGSPVINKDLQVVGLVFDGNIESLPGRFIYVPDANRSVSVTATGMIGALKYIFKAKRLVKELTE